MKKSALVATLLMLSCMAHATDQADQIQRLATTIQNSPFGAVTRIQSVLTTICDQKGHADALRTARDQALLLLLKEGSIK